MEFNVDVIPGQPASAQEEAPVKAVVIKLLGKLMGGPDGVRLRDQLQKLKGESDHGNRNVVVDLSEVGVMNSSGLAMLISGMQVMRRAGGDIRLACMTDHIFDLLKMTKLHTVFKYFDSAEEAVASYGA